MSFDWCLKMFSNSFICQVVSELGECEGVLNTYKWTQSCNEIWNSGVKRTEEDTVKENVVKNGLGRKELTSDLGDWQNLGPGANEISPVVTYSICWFLKFSIISYLYSDCTKWFVVTCVSSHRWASRSHSSECQIMGYCFPGLVLLLGSWSVAQNSWAPVLSKIICESVTQRDTQTHTWLHEKLKQFHTWAILSREITSQSHQLWGCEVWSIILQSFLKRWKRKTTICKMIFRVKNERDRFKKWEM